MKTLGLLDHHFGDAINDISFQNKRKHLEAFVALYQQDLLKKNFQWNEKSIVRRFRYPLYLAIVKHQATETEYDEFCKVLVHHQVPKSWVSSADTLIEKGFLIGHVLETKKDKDQYLYVTPQFEILDRLILFRILVQRVTQVINADAGRIISVFLSLMNKDADGALSFHQISHQLDKSVELKLENDPSNRNKSVLLEEYLKILVHENHPFLLKKDGAGGGQYVINWKFFLKDSQRSLLLNIATEKHGTLASRILRIVNEKQYIDEKQIGKLALANGKETRAKLYALMRSGLISLQEVPKTADRIPSRTYYYWCSPMDKISQHLSDKLNRTMIRLKLRIRQLMRTNSRLYEKMERKDVNFNLEMLSEEEKAHWGKLKRQIDVMELYIVKLEENKIILECSLE